jgi:integrase
VKRAHRAAAERAKIKGHFRLYDLRHTFATRTAAVGMSLPTLAAILGHTTIQMTMRYVHPAAEEKRLGMNKFEQFRAEGIMNAAMASGSRGVTTKVTTLEQVQ